MMDLEAEKPARRFRILFVIMHPGYVRTFEGALRLLLERGHQIELSFTIPSKQASDQLAEQLADDYPGLTISRAAKASADGWRNLSRTLNGLADFSRYLHPRYSEATSLRDRVVTKVLATEGGGGGLAPLRWGFIRACGSTTSARVSSTFVRFWLFLADHLPVRREAVKAIRASDPDLVLATPLVAVGSQEHEYIRAAKRMGIRTGVCVASWDNLTNKGLIKGDPDRVVVWNEVQRVEAHHLHGIPPDRVLVTGAQRFDDWFEQQPTWDRESFCAHAGLPADRPYILYLCSSPFIAPDEVSFVRRTLEAIRLSPLDEVRNCSMLIRPHPQNAEQWEGVDLSDLGPVSVWPQQGAQPVSESSRAVFFDSIYHSATVMGVNTSAQIEAAIIGRSVHTLLAEEFADTQEGTLHFHHLLHENGGLLQVATTMDGLLENLNASITNALDDSEQLAAFVGSFVRPLGMDVPGTPVVAQAIEEMAAIPAPASFTSTRRRRLVELALRPLATLGVPPHKRMAKTRQASLRALRRIPAWRRLRPEKRQEKGAPISTRTMVRTIRRNFKGTESDSTPVVAGPWLGSHRLELLYWIPFLRWACNEYRIDTERLIVISEGGVQGWYRGLCGACLDVREILDPDAIALAPRTSSKAAARVGGTARARVVEATNAQTTIEPSMVEETFAAYRADRMAVKHATRRLDMRTLRMSGEASLSTALPDRYVVVGLAFTPWFPDTETNRGAISNILTTIARGSAVVVLDGAASEGATTGRLELPEGAAYLADLADIPPGGQLEAATIAVAGSIGFVGVYGYLAHVAQSYGLGAIAMYSEPARLPYSDIDLAGRLATARPGWILPLASQQVSQVERLVASPLFAADSTRQPTG